jgi:hypothetical protein
MVTDPGWDQAALTRSESGSLDLPFPGNSWERCRDVWLDGDRLFWSVELGNPETVPKQKQGTGLLDGFVRLADASPEKILAYARKWGILEICEHGLPSTHASMTHRSSPMRGLGSFARAKSERQREPVRQPGEICPPRAHYDSSTWVPGQLFVFSEPVSAWTEYARQARALLNLIAQHARGQPLSMDDLRVADPTIETSMQTWHRPGISAAQFVIGSCVNDWLMISEPTIRMVYWEPTTPALRLMEGGLFGAIAISLAMKAVRSDGLAICSGCGTGYTPSRMPRRGTRTYCLACRAAGVPQRDATRAMRARQRVGKD